jgi:MOSC domain-containing protein YiiM
MSQVGKVLSLYISTKEYTDPIEKREIAVDSKGIIGDKHYDTDIQRSVLITSIESYVLANAHQIKMAHSSLGDNLLIDYNPYTLPIGSKLKIGDTVLEISQNCTLCNHLSNIDKKLPKLLKNDRGVFAKVVQAGSIKVDDSIYLLN